ncbi:hypothetical protein B9Z55_006357 [Caenorhabditis nigoni]|uniref:Uncharacterized protein n=1 Tax=Caenorhabditis nigoni TaxID=1611254 RepID=A0A2G5V4U7_9PELO|nr:hypothetical protein B9Z55_006357 [Caenorhabditis nigoni]
MTSLSPIELEELRDRQKKELDEQRNAMNQQIMQLNRTLTAKKTQNNMLQCCLESQTEERKYLENKLAEDQERHNKQKIIFSRKSFLESIEQKSIDQLTRDLEKEVNWVILILKLYEFQNQRGNHLEDCIKGEIRHAIDVARILENAQVAK